MCISVALALSSQRALIKGMGNGISYELAKELKDAGFPQIVHGDPNDFNSSASSFFISKPTLSELIKAISYPLFHLRSQGNAFWLASVERLPMQQGFTPEEAVAKLWLALNKRN